MKIKNEYLFFKFFSSLLLPESLLWVRTVSTTPAASLASKLSHHFISVSSSKPYQLPRLVVLHLKYSSMALFFPLPL